MPAKSRAQQRYFGMLYSRAKSGDISSLSQEDQIRVRKIGLDKLREYAKTKHNALPDKVAGEIKGENMYKIAGHEYKVSKETAEAVIKLGYLSELGHMDKEAEAEMEKDAAPIGATLKTMYAGMKPHIKSIGKTISSGSKKMWSDATKMFKGTPVAEAAKASPATPAIKKMTSARMGIKPQTVKLPKNTPGAEKVLGKATDAAKAPSIWKTRARWGMGGLAVGAAGMGALKSNEGAPPPVRYYG